MPRVDGTYARVGTIAAVVIWMFYRAPLVYFVLGMNWVEVKFIEAVGGKGTGFMADAPALPAPPSR